MTDTERKNENKRNQDETKRKKEEIVAGKRQKIDEEVAKLQQAHQILAAKGVTTALTQKILTTSTKK
jgi:hypothetical protein